MSNKIERLEHEIKDLKEKLKVAKEKESEKVFYYILNGNVVEMRRSKTLPNSGDFAYWQGNPGNKTLETKGTFEEQIQKLQQVSGKGCIRITPILKKHGFKYNPNKKIWVNSVTKNVTPV